MPYGNHWHSLQDALNTINALDSIRKMEINLILSNISKHIELSHEAKQFLLDQLKITVLEKKELVLREGNICQNIFFVNSGFLRAYVVNNDGKESTVMFGDVDWWITDMYCFQNKLPAILNIEALAKSQVFVLSKDRFDSLLYNFPEFNQYFRILFQNAYCREQLRSIQNLTINAKLRYENFISKYPDFAEKSPQKYIASYLGVTPEFMSTIKSSNKNNKS